MKRVLAVLGVIVVVSIAYYLASPLWRTVMLDEPSPLGEMPDAVMNDTAGRTSDQRRSSRNARPRIVAKAAFIAQAHDVGGSALRIDMEESPILRFENFKTINGPNLHVYLAADLEANDYVDLGPLRATEGNVNYDVPAGLDFDRYRHVLVWCVPFGVLFSSASF